MRRDVAILVAKSLFWRLGHPRATLRALLPRFVSLPVRQKLLGLRRGDAPARATPLVPAQLEAELSAVAPAAGTARGPLVSIVVPTFNNLEVTRLSLESLRKLTGYEPFEVIVVDNASSDGTRDWLRANAERLELRVLLNAENRGFAAASNQGAREARGDVLVFLNNDVIVTPGWLARLVEVLDERRWAGLAGPVTNAIGNEARVGGSYTTLEELLAHAAAIAARERGKLLDARSLAFFCVAMRRGTWETVGELDERFGLGLFEDDDYAIRVRRAGMRNVIVRDAFVHHWHEASFRRLPSAEYVALYERNRALFREKWRR